jgi:hypothetical protein
MNKYQYKILELICKFEKKQCISAPIPFTFQEARKIYKQYFLNDFFPLKGFMDNLNRVMCPMMIIQKDFSHLFRMEYTHGPLIKKILLKK